MSGFKPVFVDIDPKNLSMNLRSGIKKITKKYFSDDFMFLYVHTAQGFNGLSERFSKRN